MPDNIGILIKAFINSNKDDMQKQIDSLAKKVKLNLNPKINLSEESINKFKSDIEKLASKVKVNLQVNVDKKSFDEATKQASQATNKIKEETKKNFKNGIQIFDKEKLEKDGKEYLTSYRTSINGVREELKKQYKDMQDISNIKLFQNAKGSINSFEAQILKLNGQIEKVKYNLAYIKEDEELTKGYILKNRTISQGKTPLSTILPITKTSVSNADQGDMYQKITSSIEKLNAEIIKNGGEVKSWSALTNAKTNEITGATIQYADSLGRVRTEIYKVKEVYQEINGKKQLSFIDLEKTNNKYSQDISKQQLDNYNKLKSEMKTIWDLQIKKQKLNSDDVNLAKVLDEQITKHKKNYAKILETKISIDKVTSANAITEQQNVKLSELMINNQEKLARIQAKTRTTSTTTSGQRVLGEEVNIGKSINFNASKEQLTEYAKSVAGVNAEWTKMTPKQDKLGNKIKEVNVRVKEGSDKWRNFTMTLDETTGKLYKVDRGLSDVTNRQLGFGAAMKTALQKFPVWIASATLVMGTIHQFSKAIDYIHQFDDATVELTKVVDLSNSKIIEMKNSAIEMGKALGQSSVDIMKGMAEFGRVTKDTEEIKALTNTAILASNVTSLSVQDAAKAIESAMIQFKISGKDSIEIINQWNELQNNYAVSAENLASGLSKVGSIASQTNLPMAKLNAMVTTLVASLKIGGDEAGTALKAMISRVYRIGEDGAEDAGKTEEMLNKLGVAVRKNKDEFLPFDQILSSISEKFGTMTQAQKLALEQQMGGTYHYAKVAALLQNQELMLKATTTAYNSQNSAIIENQKYLDSISGRLKIMGTTWENITTRFLNSDFLKNSISGMTEFLNVIDRVTTGLGGFNTVLLLTIATFGVFKAKAIVGVIETLTLMGLEAGKTSLSMALFKGTTIALSTSIKTLGVSLLALIGNPMTWLIAALVAIPAGIILWTNHNQKLIEQQKELTDAQNAFNDSLKQFNQTLESTNLSKLESDLLKIKNAVKYDEVIKKIDKVKAKIASLSENEKQTNGYQYTEYVALTDQLNELEKQIKPVTDAENKLKEATERLKEPFIITNGIIVLNKQLLEQWASSKSEITQKMLRDTITLATQELNKETEILNKKLANYNLEIESLKTLAEVRRASFLLAEQNTGGASDVGVKSGLASSYEDTILQIKDKQDYLKNLGTTSSQTYFSPPSNKDKNKTPIPYEDLSAELIRSYNYQVEEDKIDNELLEKKIKLAQKQKDYNKELELSNQLLQNQQKTIKDIESANAKILQEEQNVKSRTKYNTDDWFTPTGEASLKYKQLLNSFAGRTDNASKISKKNIEDLFKSLYDLKNAWKENENAIISMNDSIDQTKQSISSIQTDVSDKLVDLYKDMYNSQKDVAISAIEKQIDAEDERHEKALDNLDEELDKYEEIINAKLKSIEEESDTEDYKNNLEKLTKERNEISSKINLLSMDDSIEAKSKLADLNKDLATKDEEISKIQNERTKELRKDNLDDQLDAYKKDVDAKKDAEDDKNKAEKKRLDNLKKDTEKYYDNLLNDERKFANIRQQIISGNLSGIESDFATFANYIKENSETIGKSLSENLNDKISEARKLLTNNSSASTSSNSHKDYLDSTWDGGSAQYIKSQQDRYKNAVQTGDVELANKLKADAQRVKYDLSLDNKDLTYLDQSWSGGAVQYVSSQRARYQEALKNKDMTLISKLIADAKKLNYKLYHEGGIVGNTLSNPKAQSIANLLLNVKPSEQLAKLKLNDEVLLTQRHLLNIPNMFNNYVSSFNQKQPDVATVHPTYNLNINIESMNANSKSEVDKVFTTIRNGLKSMGVK